MTIGIRRGRGPRSRTRVACAAVVVALVSGACGGGDGDDSAGSSGDGAATTTSAETGDPESGGTLVYGLEAETAGGFCLPEAQLAVSGIQVARSMYETLTAPNADGEYVPLLAESVTPNDAYDEWTIVLRDGIKFHDGTDLTAEVVKNNIDAGRGFYPARHPLLGPLVMTNWGDVTVTGPLTLAITTKTAWPAFPAHLYASGRVGIMAQAQLDDPDHCSDNMIGTGPFMLDEWVPNDHLTVVRNPDYWREGLPYLDAIEFRPILEATQRVNALQSGEVQATHMMNSLQVAQLQDLAEQGEIGIYQTDEFADTVFTMLNTSKPPFDSLTARRALATAIDNETLNEVREKSIPQRATGPFPPGSIGYLDDSGLPGYDPEEAKRLVAKYEEESGASLTFTILSTPEPANIETGQMVKEMAAEAGIEIDLQQIEEAQLINQVLGGDYNAVFWRAHGGGDPDLQYSWWRSDSPVNFGRFADTEIDRLLDEGRQEPDPAAREQIYQDLNRHFAERIYNVWSFWSMWTIGTTTDVHGVIGPDLPDGSKPFPGLADGHPVTGMWIEQ